MFFFLWLREYEWEKQRTRVKESKKLNKREMEARERLTERDGEGLTVQKERNETVESNITRESDTEKREDRQKYDKEGYNTV